MREHRPLRIAVVTETFPPDVNGVAMSLSRLIGGLRARGHAIDLYRVRPADGDLHAGIQELGGADSVSVTAVRGLPIPAYPELRMGLPAGRLLARRWRAARPDVVHIATEGPLGWSALRAARELGLPVSSDFRTNFDHYATHYGVGWLARPVGAALRAFHNRTDLTTVPTSALQHELAARGFRRLRVLGRGVDATLFDSRHRCEALRAGWGADANTPVALCVGRLAAEKNLDLAIAAFEAMRDSAGDARLVMVGDGPLRAALEKRAPYAIFAGRQTGADLARHYASADVFLFPSLSETFGNVVTEAMASGLATIAFRHAAAGELIDSGRNGILIEPDAPRDFIAAARAVGANRQRCTHLGEQARKTVEHLDWPAIAMQFDSMIEALLDGERPAVTATTSPRLRASTSRAA